MTDGKDLRKEKLLFALTAAFEYYDRSLTGHSAAKYMTERVYEVVCAQAISDLQDPELEVGIFSPADGDGEDWRVAWPAGPFEWAVEASFPFGDLTGRLVETNYGSDLIFYEHM